jgi:hypothetical protein
MEKYFDNLNSLNNNNIDIDNNNNNKGMDILSKSSKKKQNEISIDKKTTITNDNYIKSN